MNCPVCGANNAPGSKFCIGCGNPLPVTQAAPVAPVAPVAPAAPMAPTAPVATAQPKEKVKVDFNEVKERLVSTVKPIGSKIASLWKNPKIKLGVLGGAVLLLVAMILCSIFGGGNGYVQRKENIRFVQSDEGEYSVIVGKKVLKTTIESKEGLDDSTSSLNGKVAAVLTGENELYVVKGSKVKLVAEDVQDYVLSVDGKGIAYSVCGEDDENVTLYLAKVSNAKSTEITDNLGGNYVIAPNGKSVAYYEDGGEDPDELMLYNGKKSTSICDDEGSALYGMSNSGKQIYVSLDKDDEVVLYSFNKKGDKTKLETLGSSYSIYFNDDHTQVLFENEDGKSYIATKGKAAVKACSGSLELIIAPGSAEVGNTYPVSNLYNHVYQSGDEAHLIKKNKDIKLVSKASMMQLDGDAEYLYYGYDYDEIRCIKISQGEKASERAKTIVNEFTSYVVTSDRKYVYYMDGLDTLMCVNGKKGGAPRQVADDVDFSSGIALSDKDVFYYVLDDDLYAVSNGKKGKKVLSDVESVYSTENGYVYAENEDAFFVSTGSKKPKKVLDLDY